jgi:preprotein translocase subunit SecA
MAGRGADIRPDAAALAEGGLHVFLTEPHDAARIDRQLAGRAARQGEPGALHVHASLDDAILRDHLPRAWLALARRLPPAASNRLILLLARRAQARAERMHARMRRELWRADHALSDLLAFTGERE